jgi:hypothetical protein
MQLQNGKPDLSCRTPWWKLMRQSLMALFSAFRPEMHYTSYRPEQHYMRGPGPKWHAKHARLPTDQPVRKSLPYNTVVAKGRTAMS